MRWDATQNGGRFGAVLISIDVVNRCGRDLGQLELWFRAIGWRDGGVVQTTQGHPMQDIREGRSAQFALDLPGSLDWYDRVTLEVLDGPP